MSFVRVGDPLLPHPCWTWSAGFRPEPHLRDQTDGTGGPGHRDRSIATSQDVHPGSLFLWMSSALPQLGLGYSA